MKNDLNELSKSLKREYKRLKEINQISKLNACMFNILLVKNN